MKIYAVIHWIGNEVIFDGPYTGLTQAEHSPAFIEGKHARIISWTAQEELTQEQAKAGWGA